MTTLTIQYQRGLARTRAATAQAVGQAWDNLGTYYSADVAPFLDTVLPLVKGAQAHAVTLTDAYMALRTKRAPFGIVLASLEPQLRNGVPLEDVYKRPFVTTWSALSKGMGIRDSINAGRLRATGSSEMDVALATRASASEAMARDPRVRGYERVPDGGACDFCLLVSTQTYHTEDLMPIHNRCGCTVDPIMEDDTRGPILDRDLLDSLNAKGVKVYDNGTVRTYGGADHQSVGAQVHDHGELGPVVTNADDHFTSESEALA